MTVPYTFANQTGTIPLSELDANFAAIPNFANTAATVTTGAQPNITSIGTLTTLSVTGNTVTNLIFQKAPIISLGANAGFSANTDVIAIGNAAAGNNNQRAYAIAIGSLAGYTGQGNRAIAIGDHTGYLNQGSNSVAIGHRAGNISQGGDSVAIGNLAGNNIQSTNAVAIGDHAGFNNQGPYAVAIGAFAGNNSQGSNSIAIGAFAGYPTTANNAVVINGGTTALNAPNSGLYIAPIRSDNSNVTNTVYYNTTTKELTYSVIAGSDYGNSNVAAFLPTYTGNITANIAIANYFIGNGSQLTGITANNIVGSYSNANVAAYLPTYTGNVTANYFIGNGSQLTGIGTGTQIVNGNSSINIASPGNNIVVTVGNTQSATFFTTGMSLPGNVSAANVNANRIYANAGISSTGNITTAGYFIGTFQGNVSGNIVVPGSNTQVLYNNNGNAGASTAFTFNTGSNLLTVSGNVTATGNVSGNYFVGNGYYLTGITSGNSNYSNSNVSSYLQTLTSNISTTGNVTASYYIGNGSQLTGVATTVGRTTVTITSGNLAANAAANIVATGYKGYALYSIASNNAAWVTLYTSNAAATSDYTRTISTDPTPGSGVVAEAISNASATTNFTPAVVGFNNEAVPTVAIPMKIVNNGNTTANISITLTLLKMEG
jgi:hypothetical protein